MTHHQDRHGWPIYKSKNQKIEEFKVFGDNQETRKVLEMFVNIKIFKEMQERGFDNNQQGKQRLCI